MVGLESLAKRYLVMLRCSMCVLVFTSSCKVSAHEYWLEPVGTQWQIEDTLKADIRNGQEFTGAAFPFDPQALSRAGLISATQRRALTGRLGDYPAIRMPLQEAGLHLLLLETTRRELVYEDFDKLSNFLDYHGLAELKQQHRMRNLPDSNIIEHYYRYCKALFVVNAKDAGSPPNDYDAAPALQAQEQRLELIALDNPIRNGTLQLQLNFEGDPLAGRQVELFHRSTTAEVSRTTAISDDHGRVSFDIAAAGGYLLNSVNVLESINPSVHWVTLWASLYFQKQEK